MISYSYDSFHFGITWIDNKSKVSLVYIRNISGYYVDRFSIKWHGIDFIYQYPMHADEPGELLSPLVDAPGFAGMLFSFEDWKNVFR